jgi:hypothetical protein
MKEKSSSYNKQIATKWFDAFNEHDVEKILLLYDENAEHYSPKLKLRMPETKGLINGKDSFDRLPSLQYEVINLTADEDQVFMEYIRHVSGEDDLSVGEVLQIENGLIKFSRVYHG